MDIEPTKFTFTKIENGTKVEHTVSDPGITWWELSEFYFEFLKGCGYYMTRQEIADYFDETSDADGFDIEII